MKRVATRPVERRRTPHTARLVELVLVDADGRAHLVDSQLLKALGLAVEHGEAPALIKVLLNQLRENILFFFGAEPNIGIRLVATPDKFFCLSCDSVLVGLLAAAEEAELAHVVEGRVALQVVVFQINHLL